MRSINAQAIDTPVDVASVRPPSSVAGKVQNSVQKLAIATAATLALTGVNVAEADIVVLPTWVNSMTLSGNFYWPTSTGGVGTYLLFNEDSIEFRGESVLWTPIEGGIYTLILNAMRETGEKFNMVMEFNDLRYTSPHSFEAIGSPLLTQSNLLQGINTANQNTPWTQASWDNDGIGQAAVFYGNAHINAVPEPSSAALIGFGLWALGLATARRRRNTLGAQTPGTETTPTPEGATTE